MFALLCPKTDLTGQNSPGQEAQARRSYVVAQSVPTPAAAVGVSALTLWVQGWAMGWLVAGPILLAELARCWGWL